jgi:hypothetical protein
MSFLEPDGRGVHRVGAAAAQVDIVTALHACDTATDDAIRFALAQAGAIHRARALLPGRSRRRAAPAQERVAGADAAVRTLAPPIHTREFGSQVTNVLRCLQLEAHGYQVTVTELVGWEHSMKNELIIARHTGVARSNATTRLEQILQQLNLDELRARFIY